MIYSKKKILKKFLCFLLIFIFIITFFSNISTGEISTEFEKQYGVSKFTDIIKTTDENLALSGVINNDFILVKLDMNGKSIFSKRFGTPGIDTPYSILETSDDGFILAGDVKIGSLKNNVFLVKYDSNGNLLWNKSYGLEGNEAARKIIQKNDNLIVIGSSDDTSGKEVDIYFKVLDNYGNEILTNNIGLDGSEFGYDIIKTSDSGFLIAGSSNSHNYLDSDFFIVKLDSNYNPVWFKNYGGVCEDIAYKAIQTNDSGYIICGITNSYGAGSYDGWIVKTDKDGNEEWNLTVGNRDEDIIYDIIKINDSYFIGGYTKYDISYDFFISEISSNGFLKYYKNFDTEKNKKKISSNPDEIETSMIISNNSIYFAGYIQGFTGTVSHLLKTTSIKDIKKDGFYPKVFTGQNKVICPGDTVEFEVSAEDFDGEIVKYRYDFNADGKIDKTTTSAKVESYTYCDPGIYDASVEVEDSAGLLSRSIKKITVKEKSSNFFSKENVSLIGVIITILGFILLIYYEQKTKFLSNNFKKISKKNFIPISGNIWTFYLFLSFVFIFLIKFFIGILFETPNIFFDELAYTFTANNIAKGSFPIISETSFTHGYPAAYSYIISPAHIFGPDMSIVYRMMLTINIFISTLVMFPTYLIMKRFVSRKTSFITSLIVATIPAITLFSYQLMSESLFCLMFLVSAFLILKTFTYEELNYKFLILTVITGLSVGFLVLIRAPGIAMFPALIAVVVYKIASTRTIKSLFYSIPLIPFIPAIFYIFFSGDKRPLGYGVEGYVDKLGLAFSNVDSFMHFLKLALYQINYFALISYVVFFIFIIFLIINFRKIKKEDMGKTSIFLIYGFFSVIFLSVITISHIYSGKYELYTRYISVTLPVIFMLGIIGGKLFNRIKNKFYAVELIIIFSVFSFLIILSFPKTGFKPVNAQDLLFFLKSTALVEAVINPAYEWVLYIPLIIGIPLFSYVVFKYFQELKKKTLENPVRKNIPYLLIGVIFLSIFVSIPSVQEIHSWDQFIADADLHKPGQYMSVNLDESKIIIDNSDSAFSGGGMNPDFWEYFKVSTMYWFPEGKIIVYNKNDLQSFINSNENKDNADYILSTHDLTGYYQKIKTFELGFKTNKIIKNDFVAWNLYKI